MAGRAAGGDTIAAISSPPGAGERAVVRLSGERAFELLNGLVLEPLAPPDRRGLASLVLDDGVGEQPALALLFPGPRSFTREDVVELHVSAGPGLAEAVLARLLALGARLAEPGEFTRRAFEHGRIDLTRAEGVLELVSAGGEAERRAAAQLLAGGLATRVAAVRERLEDLRALCEASLDFDQEDTSDVPRAELAARFDAARAALDEALGWELARAAPTGLPRVVLLGAPNAGKSSLFNALAGRDAALVADLAGTTRDRLEARLDVSGRELLLVDAPGLDGASEELGALDRAAQDLARAETADADLILWVVDGRRSDVERLRVERPGRAASRLLVWTQLDRPDARPEPPAELLEEGAAGPGWVGASAPPPGGADGPRDPGAPGVDGVRAAVAVALGGLGEGAARALFVRHRDALVAAAEGLERARQAFDAEAPLDWTAEVLREATDGLDRIAGRTTPEEILDRIFARFCLGK